MSTEKNLQTVKDFFAAIGRGDRPFEGIRGERQISNREIFRATIAKAKQRGAGRGLPDSD